MGIVRGKSFAARHLDPGTRMGEILFGLIMTLTFTLGAGLVIEEEGREGARAMLIGILGCNLAWGIIDGVFYVLGRVFDRGRLRRVGLKLRSAASDAEAHRMVAEELDEQLGLFTDESERERLYRSVAERVRAIPPAPNPVRRGDLMGGLAAGWLVFACSFPAVLPFLVLDEPHVALRVSNAILLALLFYVGWHIARYTLAKPWVTGTTFLLFGLLLVVVAIALGG
jgi:hypothetical protein